MNTVTLVSDPIARTASVQFEIIDMLLNSLEDHKSINFITPYLSNEKLDYLKRGGKINITILSSSNSILHFLYSKFERNESMLWALSWLYEGLFSFNSETFKRISGSKNDEEAVLNLSYTIPANCSLFWNQATPPLITLNSMGRTNFLAKLIYHIFGRIFIVLDRKIIRKHMSLSTRFANNSRYLEELYSSLGYKSEDVIYTPKQFTKFFPPPEAPSRDFVLAYIGKEVEVDTIISMVEMGVKVVTFGAKIPYGTSLSILKERTDFRGFVSKEELSNLYYNALFTAFPFTEEPFGWVPLESMHHGTPVLSYNKQGPAETILNLKTGWLVNNKEEFLEKSLELWNAKETGILTEDCMLRVEDFSYQKTIKVIKSILENSCD